MATMLRRPPATVTTTRCQAFNDNNNDDYWLILIFVKSYYDQTIASLHQEVAALKEANLRTSLYYDNQPGYAAPTTNNVGYS